MRLAFATKHLRVVVDYREKYIEEDEAAEFVDNTSGDFTPADENEAVVDVHFGFARG